MPTDSFTIRFYLNKAKRKGDKFKIYTRIIVNRKKAEFATQLEIEELLWDPQSGRVKKSNPTNDELVDIENSLRRIRRKLLDEDKSIDAYTIVEYYKGKKDFDSYFLRHFDRFLKEWKPNRRTRKIQFNSIRQQRI